MTAFVLSESNQMVHTAGGGIFFAIGHDDHAIHNRVVSCGETASGTWFAMPYTAAIGMVDVYNAGNVQNNSILSTSGGLLRLGAQGATAIADFDPAEIFTPAQHNPLDTSAFDDPCLPSGVIYLAAEAAERASWAAAGQTVGSE